MVCFHATSVLCQALAGLVVYLMLSHLDKTIHYIAMHLALNLMTRAKVEDPVRDPI